MLDKKYNEVFKNVNIITRHVAYYDNNRKNRAILLDTSANDIVFKSKHKEFSTAQYQHCYQVRQYYTDMCLDYQSDDDAEVTLDLIVVTYIYTNAEIDDATLVNSTLAKIVFSIDYDAYYQDERETMLMQLY